MITFLIICIVILIILVVILLLAFRALARASDAAVKATFRNAGKQKT